MKYVSKVVYQGGFVMGLEDTPLHRRISECGHCSLLSEGHLDPSSGKYVLDFSLCSLHKLQVVTSILERLICLAADSELQ